MSIDEVLSRIKDKFACDYNINGCDTCDISSCEDRNIIIQLSKWLEELKAKRKMLNFLFEVINPNDMEDYMRIYNSTDVKVDGGKNE